MTRLVPGVSFEPERFVILVEKVFAYVTHRRRLLVFEQPGSPEAGVQVPAGTLEPGEAPRDGVLREAEEETGLCTFGAVESLGTADFDGRPFGRDEVHRRHFFHLPVSGTLPERWTHHERHASGAGREPIAFALRWASLGEAAQVLSAGHGALLPELERGLAAASAGSGGTLASPADELRSEIAAFLSSAPPSSTDIPIVVHESVEADGYTRRLIGYPSADGEEIPAFFFEPHVPADAAGVLVLHQHNSEWLLGKSEVAGLHGDPVQAFGPALAKRGVRVLAPDALGFEARRGRPVGPATFAPPITKPFGTPDGWLQYHNHAAHRLVRGELLMTKLAADTAAGVGALTRLTGVPEVGMLGHSHGGNVALFAAALDSRVAFTCASGAVCSYRFKLSRGIGLDFALMIPGFAARFDVDDLVRAIAPRRLFVVSADGDPYSADASEVVLRALPEFERKGCAAHLTHRRAHGPHALDADRAQSIVDWVAGQAGCDPDTAR